jgi:hypothetical protein
MQMHSPEENNSIADHRRSAIAIAYGALCHATFAIGVGTMIFSMYTGTSVGLGPFQRPWNWLANAVLILQFPPAAFVFADAVRTCMFLRPIRPMPPTSSAARRSWWCTTPPASSWSATTRAGSVIVWPEKLSGPVPG